ncbi:hypothetical protein HGB07_08395, partial [Candidatus Roizmanbacteria bacterium]|nr:hypothetical protein [Candidatus Roizmanbacteria bacterium]
MNSTTPQLEIRWKVIAVLPNEPPVFRDSLVFNKSYKTGLFSQFDINPSLSYVPTILTPTITYHQSLRNHLKTKGLNIQDKNYPYKVTIEDVGEVALSLQIRLYPPRIASVTVTIKGITNPDLIENPEKLIEIQRLDKWTSVNEIVHWTLDVIDTFNHKKRGNVTSMRSRPIMHFKNMCDENSFKSHLSENTQKFIGVLIRNKAYSHMNPELTRKITEKNQELNLKDQNELMLIDKQGLLYVTPIINDAMDKKYSKMKYTRTSELYELAMVFRALLDSYSELRLYNEDFTDFLLHKIQPWINESNMVFTESVSNKHIWNLLINEFELTSRLRLVTRQSEVISSITEKSRYFSQFTRDWWAQADFSYTLSSTIEEGRGLNIDFISNKELRRLVLEDYQEAKRSLYGQNYKSTILLCGSIAETILTDVVDQAAIPGITTGSLLKDFNLGKLIDAAKANSILKDEILITLLNPLREYRNMIHPGVSLRKSLSADKSKANIALEIVNLLVKELRANSKTR